MMKLHDRSPALNIKQKRKLLLLIAENDLVLEEMTPTDEKRRLWSIICSAFNEAFPEAFREPWQLKRSWENFKLRVRNGPDDDPREMLSRQLSRVQAKEEVEEEIVRLVKTLMAAEAIRGENHAANANASSNQSVKHHTTILGALSKDTSFVDITLTAEGHSIKAHKAVLSAVSPYFTQVLKDNPCQHPIIIMPQDVKYESLQGIIGFIYTGEITISSESLSSFLKAASLLQITGLSESRCKEALKQNTASVESKRKETLKQNTASAESRLKEALKQNTDPGRSSSSPLPSRLTPPKKNKVMQAKKKTIESLKSKESPLVEEAATQPPSKKQKKGVDVAPHRMPYQGRPTQKKQPQKKAMPWENDAFFIDPEDLSDTDYNDMDGEDLHDFDMIELENDPTCRNSYMRLPRGDELSDDDCLDDEDDDDIIYVKDEQF